MTNLSVFVFQGHDVRFVGTPDKPEWVAKDVCDVLGINNSREALARLEDYQKGVITTDTLGGIQKLATVTEPGLYGLIFTSRKEIAKEFQHWVFSEVLPSIRKTGSYGVPEKPQALPQRDIVEYVQAAKSLESLPDSILKTLLKDAFVDEMELQRTNTRALPPGDRKQYTIAKVRAKQLGYSDTDIKNGTGLGRFVHSQVKPEFQEMVGRYPVYHYEITPELDTAIHTYFGAK